MQSLAQPQSHTDALQQEVVKCDKCQSVASKRTVTDTTSRNKGREFYCCPSGCKFFHWAKQDTSVTTPIQNMSASSGIPPNTTTTQYTPAKRQMTQEMAMHHAPAPKKMATGTTTTSHPPHTPLQQTPPAPLAPKAQPQPPAYKSSFVFGSGNTQVNIVPAQVKPKPTAPLPNQQTFPQLQPLGSGPRNKYDIKCYCQLMANEFTVKKEGANKGKLFFCCPKEQTDPSKCKFWIFEQDYLAGINDVRKPQSREIIMHNHILSEKRQLRQEEKNEAGQRIQLQVQDQPTRTDIATRLFADMAKEKNYTCTLATSYEFTYHHKHMRICRGPYHKDDYWINIQSAKKLYPTDKKVQYDYQWLQVHGAQPDDKGWIIDGQSIFIAFEGIYQNKRCFFIANRRSLWEYIDTQLSPELAADPISSIGKWYKTPKGYEHEIRSLCRMQDLVQYSENNPDKNKIVIDYWFVPEHLLIEYEKRIGEANLPHVHENAAHQPSPPLSINNDNATRDQENTLAHLEKKDIEMTDVESTDDNDNTSCTTTTGDVNNKSTDTAFIEQMDDICDKVDEIVDQYQKNKHQKNASDQEISSKL